MIRKINVRKTTKFKRSVKAISPVIATLLMIAIAVVASLVVYAWVTGYMGTTTSKAGKAIQIQSFAVGTNGLHVYVQNVGQGALTLSTAYVNSTLQNFTPDSNFPDNVLPEGDTADILVAGTYNANDKIDIKITTTEGTFMTTSGTVKIGGSGSPGGLSFSVQPASQTINSGQTATLTSTATGGTTPYTWQWYHTAGAISGASGTGVTATYSTGAADTGIYVIFTDANSLTATSSPTVSVTVTSGPTISVQPASQTINSGQTATLTSTATGGTTPYTWQWYHTAGAISGASGTGVTATYSTGAADTGIYVIFTDANSLTATSSPTVSVTVTSGPTISVQPASQTINSGQTATLTSTATGGTTPYTWQWYHTAGAISGASGTGVTATYSTGAADTGIYVIFTDANSLTATSSPTVSVTVNSAAPAPTIDGHAQGGNPYWSNTNNRYEMQISLTTTKDNDLLYLSWVGNSGRTITGITSSDGITWTQRALITSNNDGSHRVAAWYAVKPTHGVVTITIALSSDTSTNCAAVAIGINGANTASPFDGNARTATGSSIAPRVTLSTTASATTNELVLGILGSETTGTVTAGFGTVADTDANGRTTSIESGSISSPQTNLAVGYTTGNQPWGMIADAIKSP